MAIEIPTHNQIINRIRADVAANLPDVDPTIYGSYVRALADSLAGRIYDMGLLLKQLEKELFPQSASKEYLERWAGYEGLERKVATISEGTVTVVGPDTTPIPISTQIRASNGNVYETQAAITLVPKSIDIDELTSVSITATATVDAGHNLATGMTVVIAGADPPEYNGTYLITVTSTTTFDYTFPGSATSPATTPGNVSYTGEIVNIESIATGSDQNLESGAQLYLVTPIGGADISIYVQYDGITGGTDTEKDPELLTRTLQRRANPVANFNVAAIESVVLSVPGVTRVKVKRNYLATGQVTILFLRDNDEDPIPGPAAITAVENVIHPIVPAQSPLSDIFIEGPTAVIVNFDFLEIVPDTPTMRDAIYQNLVAFFQDEVLFETPVTRDKFRSAIIETVDPANGDLLTSFILNDPIDDIFVNSKQIGLLGTVSYAS